MNKIRQAMTYLKDKIKSKERSESREFYDFYHLAIRLVKELKNLREDCCIIKGDTQWFYIIGLSIIKNRLNGKKVRILCRNPIDDKEKVKVETLIAYSAQFGHRFRHSGH